MNILIISHHWYPENGVHQRRWTWLSKVLIDAGHQVTVITPPPHDQRAGSTREGLRSFKLLNAEAETGQSGESIFRTPYLPSNNSLISRGFSQVFVAATSLLTSLKRSRGRNGQKPDLIIGTVPALPTSVITYLVALFQRRPYIIDLRDAWPDLLDQITSWNEGVSETSRLENLVLKGPLNLGVGMIRRIVNNILRMSSGIVVTAENLEHHLRESTELWRDKPPVDITTVRNVFPAETDYLATDKSPRPDDELRVLYAGTLGRAQHLQNAIEAVRIAEEKGLTVHLRMVGAGATRQALVKHAREVDGAIEILSRKPADELNADYDWADTALVHLTHWEPLTRAVPSKTYELMASRIHISAVVSGEAAELVKQQGAGDVVDPADPEGLADLWIHLAKNRDHLAISGRGADWVSRERETIAPHRLLKLVDTAVHVGRRPFRKKRTGGN